MREEPTAWGSHVSDSKWDRSGLTLELVSKMPWASTRGIRGRPVVSLHQGVRCQQAGVFGALEGRGPCWEGPEAGWREASLGVIWVKLGS